jgi:hypothetical protein
VEPTHFELRAPEGCSSPEDFAARVRKRSARISLIAGPAPRSLVVEIKEQSPGVLRGSVRVVERGGSARSRQLKASSCAEAIDALSLIATVTLDPDALLAEPEPEPEPELKPEVKPPPPASEAPRARRPRPAMPAPGAEGAPFRLSLGVGAAVLFNQAPKLAPGGSATLALELRPGQVLAPFFRLSVVHAQRRGLVQAGGKASFAFTLPTLDVCPVRLGPRGLGIRPCAYVSLGLLAVSGEALAVSESHTRLSGAGGGVLWLGARITETFEIIADIRVGASFPRDAFGFDDRAFFTTPRLGFSAGLGLAGGFP